MEVDQDTQLGCDLGQTQHQRMIGRDGCVGGWCGLKDNCSHLTESQCDACYDLTGSSFEVPFEIGLDGSRADGLVKHRIECPSAPELTKPAHTLARCSGESSKSHLAGLSRLKGGGKTMVRLIPSRSMPSRALAAAPPKSL